MRNRRSMNALSIACKSASLVPLLDGYYLYYEKNMIDNRNFWGIKLAEYPTLVITISSDNIDLNDEKKQYFCPENLDKSLVVENNLRMQLTNKSVKYSSFFDSDSLTIYCELLDKIPLFSISPENGDNTSLNNDRIPLCITDEIIMNAIRNTKPERASSYIRQLVLGGNNNLVSLGGDN